MPEEQSQPKDKPESRGRQSEMRLNEQFALESASEVKSPCIDVCLLEDGVCQGCFRSIREIAAWSSVDADLKRRILQECDKRRHRRQ